MKTTSLLAVLLVIGWSGVALAHQSACSDIRNPTERLICYDREHGKKDQRDFAKPASETEPIPLSGVLASAAAQRAYQGRMVFELDSGEVFLQLSARRLPVYTGDRVTIKGGAFGSLILRSESGVSTKVKRL